MRDKPLQLRIKFHAANPNPDAAIHDLWRVGPTNSAQPAQIREKLPPDSFQEFSVPPNMLDEHGILWVDVYNPQRHSRCRSRSRTVLNCSIRRARFGINFVRGLAVIFCWLALLASIGLAAASLSFVPGGGVCVARRCCSWDCPAARSAPWWNRARSPATTRPSPAYGHSPAGHRHGAGFQAASSKSSIWLQSFSPIDYLSSGRSITWGQLGLAVAQIVLLLGGFFCVCGIIFFYAAGIGHRAGE